MVLIWKPQRKEEETREESDNNPEPETIVLAFRGFYSHTNFPSDFIIISEIMRVLLSDAESSALPIYFKLI